MKNRWVVTMLVLFVGTPVLGDDILDKSFGKSYAVVVGISSYKNSGTWKTLDNTENDAKAMKELLDSQGFEVKPFIGQEATMRNIISWLEDILAPKLTRKDRFVFYFSGHGNTRSLGGREWGYLIPYDGDTEMSSTWIDVKQITYLSEKLGTARHQLFILDSCFGGLIATKGSMSTVPVGTPDYIAKVTAVPARQWLTAGGANEQTPASSNLDGYREYSQFTAYLLKGLREGAADSTTDGFITTSELYAYLQSAATTEYNTPREGDLPGHEQGDFVFRSPKPAHMTGGSPEPPRGPVKGTQPKQIDEDKHDWERLSTLGANGLNSYLKLHPDGKWANEAHTRIDLLKTAEQAKPKPSHRLLPPGAPKEPIAEKKLTLQEEAQALYEWQQDIRYSSSSRTVEQFLQRFPVGSHVQDAERKIAELRAIGQ
jgi:hypothetical protein